MLTLDDETTMAKLKSAPKPEPPEDRVSLANLKGSPEEREYLRLLSRKTGVPVAEIIRRGVAMWAERRGLAKPPADWIEE